MPVPSLPDFAHALAVAEGKLDAAGLAECHGVVCGLICRQPQQGPSAFLQLLTVLELARGAAAGFEQVLEELHRATLRQLEDEQMRLSLWLPEDNESLEERTAAVSQWCTGFLAGLGSGEEQLPALSGDAGEALEDLRQIACAEVDGAEDVEEDEVAFAEIVEYIRVVTLMLMEDLRGPDDGDRIH